MSSIEYYGRELLRELPHGVFCRSALGQFNSSRFNKYTELHRVFTYRAKFPVQFAFPAVFARPQKPAIRAETH